MEQDGFELPGDQRLVVGLAQFLGRGDAERAHEVLHVEAVGGRVRALFCFESQISSSGIGARWSRVETRRRPGSNRVGKLVSSVMVAPRVSSSYPIRSMSSPSDKPNYHVDREADRRSVGNRRARDRSPDHASCTVVATEAVR